ncbi:SAF domain-containing protein [Synechococcus sp. MIT S9220]|uniref:SAF domain-containing protein n=1 Tax=unclassified Synechococcus TaxID=2626047 RepID=UPI00351C1537
MQSLGSVSYGPRKAEEKSRTLRRSISTYKNISKGALFDETNIRIIRPGKAASPSLYIELVGKIAHKYYSAGAPISLEQLL